MKILCALTRITCLGQSGDAFQRLHRNEKSKPEPTSLMKTPFVRIPGAKHILRRLALLPVVLFTGTAALTADAASVIISANVPGSSTLPALSGTQLLPDSSDAIHTSDAIQFNRSSSQDRFGGSTFTVDSPFNVSALSFYISSISNTETIKGKQAFIQIVTFDTFTTDSITYTIKRSETVTMPPDGSVAASNYITFTFDNPVALESGDYGIIFHWLEAAPGINFRSASTDALSSRKFRITDTLKDSAVTGTGFEIQSREIFFLVHGTPIPEPVTAGLLSALAIMTFIMISRIRNSRS
ncbi:MAG: hypothetical protein LBK99_04835 [Opitutaceae bacterium]|jgi:hypothetical protein|nr:hypothetical protein [Opitutaceae bacterium]